MDGPLMVVLIVGICVLGGIWDKHLKRSRREAKDYDDSALKHELETLRERVVVLERIVTDQKFQLNQELAALEREAS